MRGDSMYFPYLRGRQYELIAIRELVDQKRLSDRVVPIIEPVKFTSTFSSSISSCSQAGHKIVVIVNPQVGDMRTNSKKSKNEKSLESIIDLISPDSQVIKALIVNDVAEKYCKIIEEKGIEVSESMALYLDRDYIELYDTLFSKRTKYNVVLYEPAYRRIRGNRIMIADRFAPIKKDRNADYANKPDEFFSDDHLYYKEDQFLGFSDFSIIGQDYQETGFAPYAVAIHIVYFDDDKNLRVRHFVSDSNDDINDPANKFYEAVSKLVDWNQKIGLKTNAIKTFEQLHSSGAYPGLGVVKKLSLMHHLELMGEYLEEAEDGNL